jgi:hypothetical protein
MHPSTERFLVRRVVTQYRQASVVSVKEYLQSFLQFKRLIEKSLKLGDVLTAKRDFVLLGEALQPLANILSGVHFSRDDEKRKMKNIQHWLYRLQYPFSAKSLDTEAIDTWISLTLETIEEALKSLLRVQDRLQGYLQVEKMFSWGPFTIHNHYGFAPGEYAKTLEILSQAMQAIKSKGLGEVLYGDVTLRGGSKEGWLYSGLYDPSADRVFLNVDVTSRAMRTLVHEFGHRLWFKVLTQAQRDLYEDLHAKEGLTLEDRQQMFQALVAADFAPNKVKLPLNLQEGFRIWFKDVFEGVSIKGLASAYARGERWMEKNFVRPSTRRVLLKSPDVVSQYATTNLSEDFAETFTEIVLGHSVPAGVQARWDILQL